ncbi:putative replicase protein [Camel associated porprismacovirus 3]|uniref:Putative replicase protein n=1 Tax=Camel associated porprismacovirus 3 TaxID=2170107 RepID=A0A0A1EL62_9VIRU|nr:putative replicase protein [Camel associated porprismacovirus 3]AIY31248.1 putative replicase protein [Camel associated porprismacovirus 3]
MVTVPTKHACKRQVKMILEIFDTKRYIFAQEKGKNGLDHWQLRIQISGDKEENFERLQKLFCNKAHIEVANDSWEYERKEGKFWSSEDTKEILKIRFGKLRSEQKKILQILSSQGDREIDVWLDPTGCHGKSWLTIHLWETGRALVVPRSSTTAEKLSAFVCSSWRGEDIIVIDVPRATKPTTSLLETMEELKDGLVFDHRYTGKTRNVRGTKLMVFTNSPLPLNKLSTDRWRLHGISADGSLS